MPQRIVGGGNQGILKKTRGRPLRGWISDPSLTSARDAWAEQNMRPEVTEPTSTPYLQISVDDPALISVPSPVVRLPPKQLAIEIASRIGAAAALSVFLAASIIQFAKNPSRITLLLFVFTALLDVGLVVFTRVVRERDWARSMIPTTLGRDGASGFGGFLLRRAARLHHPS